MTRVAALAAAAVLVGCFEDTVLFQEDMSLPDLGGGPGDDGGAADLAPDLGLPVLPCPIAIDVFGPADTLFPDCKDRPGASKIDLAGGLFAPGTPLYDNTLAGQLQSALTARFSDHEFKVRACGSPQQWLSSLAPLQESSGCKMSNWPPTLGQFQSACTQNPAPFIVLLAAEPNDKCHGGSDLDFHNDDFNTYEREFEDRIDAFLRARNPVFAFIGPQTEWTPQAGTGDFFSMCGWPRGDWPIYAVRDWNMRRGRSNVAVPDDNKTSDFKAHSACCQILRKWGYCRGDMCGNCSTWVSNPPLDMQSVSGPPVISCDGADAIVGFWKDKLRSLLASPRFDCDSGGG